MSSKIVLYPRNLTKHGNRALATKGVDAIGAIEHFPIHREKILRAHTVLFVAGKRVSILKKRG
jgi:hypothetical protein